MRLTVGPLPPAVYWRRRAIALGAVLLALFLVAQACMSASASPEQRSNSQPGGASGSPLPSAAVGSTTAPATQPPSEPAQEPTTGPSNPPADAETCTNDEMLIIAEAERTAFSGGTEVQFTIRIRNDSDRTCHRDVGGDLRELYLREAEGTTKLWSSRECGAPTGTDLEELTPSFEAEHWVVWNGRASDSCDDDEPAGELVPPGEYELVARLGTAYGDPVPITIR